MNRLLRILFYILLFILIFFWFSGIMKSCNQKKQAAQLDPAKNDNVEAVTEEVEDIVSEFFESDGDNPTEPKEETSTDDLEEEFEAGESAKEPRPSSEKIAETKMDDPVEETPEEKLSTNELEETPPARDVTDNQTSSESGPYKVIAGSFSVESNADKMVAQLHNMGYDQAAKIRLSSSNYHTVSAAGFSNRSDAIKAADILKRKGVDCYVNKVQ